MAATSADVSGLEDSLNCTAPSGKECRVIGLLGSGQFSAVWRVDGGNGGREFALKRCCKRMAAMEQKGIEHLINEKDIHNQLHHPNIVKLFSTFQDDEECCLLLELCEGGDLGLLLDQTQTQPDSAARFYLGCVVLALRHLHSKECIQRDLKPENVLLDARGYAKLADFGYSARLERAESRKYTLCGTDEYAPPEMLRNQGRSYPSDWWALGVLLHHLLLGVTPFDAEDEDEAFDRIMDYAHGDPRQRQAAQEQLRATITAANVSADACELILALLNPSERKRLDSGPAYEGAPIEEQPWFANEAGWSFEAIEKRAVPPPPRPWDAALARNCHGEYRSAPITPERAVEKWTEKLNHAAPVEARDQHKFASFGPNVCVPPPDKDVWREKNPPLPSPASPEG